jgi:hypothetical protein
MTPTRKRSHASSALVEDLGSTSGEQFFDNCRAAQPSQPTSIACQLAYLSRKPVAELEQALLRTRALVSVLRCCRSGSIPAVSVVRAAALTVIARDLWDNDRINSRRDDITVCVVQLL